MSLEPLIDVFPDCAVFGIELTGRGATAGPGAGTGIEIPAYVDEALNYEDGMDWKEGMDLIQYTAPKLALFENREG